MTHFITSSLRFLFEGPHGNVLYTGTVIKNKVVMHGASPHIQWHATAGNRNFEDVEAANCTCT